MCFINEFPSINGLFAQIPDWKHHQVPIIGNDNFWMGTNEMLSTMILKFMSRFKLATTGRTGVLRKAPQWGLMVVADLQKHEKRLSAYNSPALGG